MEPKNSKKMAGSCSGSAFPEKNEPGQENEPNSMKKSEAKENETVQKPLNQEPKEEVPEQQEQGSVEIESSAKELEQQLLYLRAEFENYKKRLLREQEQSVRAANEKLIRGILTVVTLFDRALRAAKVVKDIQGEVRSEVKDFISGIEITHRELVLVLERFGVELIGVEGEKFDPLRHEAVSQLDASSEKAGTVLSVVSKGGLLFGRLLEPAKVVVVRAVEQDTKKAD